MGRGDAIDEFAGILADCESEPDIYEAMLGAADRLSPADVGVFARATDGQLRPVAAKMSGLYRDAYLDTDDGLAGQAIQTGEAVLVDDVHQHPAVADAKGFRSALSVPIEDDAVLQLLSTERAAFTDRDTEYVRMLATAAEQALQRVRSSQQATRERNEFRALFENVADPALRCRVEEDTAVVDMVNAAFLEAFDVTNDRAVDAPLGELFSDQTGDPREATAVVRGEQIEQEIQRQTDDGTRRYMLRTIPVGGTSGGRPTRTYVIYVDIEESRRREQLEVLNRFLRHNVRNDIAVVQGHLELIAAHSEDESVADSSDAALTAVERIARRSGKARQIQDLIDSPGDRGRWQFDLEEVITERVRALEEDYPEVDVTLTLDADGEIEAHQQLAVALDEILENAVVHDNDPGPIDVTVEDDGTAVEIAIADTGPGIQQQEVDVLEQGRETSLQHGSGIGLWLTAWIVRASDGTLEFETPDAGGTVVRMTIPYKD